MARLEGISYHDFAQDLIFFGLRIKSVAFVNDVWIVVCQSWTNKAYSSTHVYSIEE